MLRKTKIFVNSGLCHGPKSNLCNSKTNVCFHCGYHWLKENGNLPDLKCNSIEMYGCEKYLANRNHHGKIDDKCCWQLCQKLAHSFHWHLTHYKPSEVDTVFQNAIASGKYNSINHMNGSMKKPYAAENAVNYFASLFTAYFTHNEHYPFTKQDIQQYDPEGYDLVTQWVNMSTSEIAEKRKQIAEL